MKKKLVTMILVVAMACSMTACGKKEEVSQNTGQTDTAVENNVTEEDVKEEKQEEKTSDEEWGVRFSAATSSKDGKTASYSISYPSLMPSSNANYITYQKDAALVMRWTNNWAEGNVNSIETMLEDGKEYVCNEMWDYRKNSLDYDDSYELSFEVESTELTTINGFPMCKYVGVNIISNGEKTYSVPFVGYAADLQVGEGAYLMWMVFDDSEFRTAQEPLKEGTIEEYALKMAESLKASEF